MQYVRVMLRRRVGIRRGVVVSAGTWLKIFGVVKELGGSDASGVWEDVER